MIPVSDTIVSLRNPERRWGAVDAIRHQMINSLVRLAPPAGTPLPSYDTLARQASVSRSTVRRAIQSLQRDGWVELREGRGLVSGTRAALGVAPHSPVRGRHEGRRLLRLAVLAMNLGRSETDTVTADLLRGLDAAALDEAVVVEVVGGETDDLAAIEKRLAQSRPDVMAMLPDTPEHLHVALQAKRIGIRCIAVAYLPELGIPCVHEDSIEAGRRCVSHLVARGHRRISVLYAESLTWWTAHRRMGIEEGLAASGLDPRNISRCSLRPAEWGNWPERVESHLREHGPTAVICSAAMHVPHVEQACRAMGWVAGEDVSVITIDQLPSSRHIGRRETSFVPLPWKRVGRTVACVAREWVDDGRLTFPDPIRCPDIQGDSVRTMI